MFIQKNLFLFDSLGFTGFKEFIIDNDFNIIDKLLYNVNRFNKNDEKINLINLKVSEYEYGRIKRKGVLSKLTDTAKDSFHLLSKFSKYHGNDTICCWWSATGNYCRHKWYKNLFDPLEDSQITEHEKLAKQTIEKVLNEIFSRDKASNEEKMEDLKEYNL